MSAKDGGGHAVPVTMLGRARLRAGRMSLVVVAVLVAITGAAAITALTGAQRTLTAYERLRERTGDPDAEVAAGRAREVVRRSSGLPGVEDHVFGHLWVSRYLDVPDRTIYISMVGYDRTARDLVHPLVVRGRMWDPKDPHQALVTEATAERARLDVGSSIHLKTLTPKQFRDWNETDPIDAQGADVSLRVVGILRDPFDAGSSGAGLFVTPAFHRHALAIGGPPVGLANHVRLRGGSGAGDRFAAGVDRLVARYGDPGAGDPDQVRVTLSSEREDVTSASRVAALGMIAFAAIAAAAGLVTLTQALGREMSRQSEHNAVWAALGMTSRERALALAGPPELALVAGTLGAIALAIAASPLSPIGAARTFEPNLGVAANLALLALGGSAWLVLISLLVLVNARRGARLAPLEPELAPSAAGRSVVTAPVMRANLPAPVAVGLRMAVERRVGRRVRLMRTPIVTATVAIAAVVAAVAFSASLVRLVTEPARYGWEGDGTIEVPEDVRDLNVDRIARNPTVDAATLVNTDQAAVAGQRTTLYGLDPLRGTLGFTTLSGRSPAAPDEIVLGPKLADQLGVGVGDSVDVRTTSAKPRVLRVVGLGLTIAADGEDYDQGALVTGATFKRLVNKPHIAVVYFRLKDSVGDKQAAATRLAGDQELVDPEAPGPIAYLDQLRYLPRLLAGLLGAVGVAAVAHGFLVGSRRWAYDLAVLRVFGFTRRQMAAAVGTMATATIVVGAVIGVPLGLILARLAWNALASDIHVATDLARPLGTVSLLVLAAVAIANGLAAAGAREVRRSRPAFALRTE